MTTEYLYVLKLPDTAGEARGLPRLMHGEAHPNQARASRQAKFAANEPNPGSNRGFLPICVDPVTIVRKPRFDPGFKSQAGLGFSRKCPRGAV